MQRLGSRGALISDCPDCGQAVTPSHDRIEVWQDKFAHRRCAEYEPRHAARSHGSPRLHTRFTRP